MARPVVVEDLLLVEYFHFALQCCPSGSVALELGTPEGRVLGGPGGATFRSGATDHYAPSRLELWPAEPAPDATRAWDEVATAAFRVDAVELRLTAVTAGPGDGALELPATGGYGVRRTSRRPRRSRRSRRRSSATTSSAGCSRSGRADRTGRRDGGPGPGPPPRRVSEPVLAVVPVDDALLRVVRARVVERRRQRHVAGNAPTANSAGSARAPGEAVGCAVVLGTRLDLDRIRAARRVIAREFLDTPRYECEPLGRALGCRLSVKLETANSVRSFKGRGTEVVASGLRSDGRRAAVCASAGNLGLALAWSGRRRGLDVTVVASRSAVVAKLDRIRALGAELELVDGDFEAARERAVELALERGVRRVEDSLDLETCEGAATIGLELAEGPGAGPADVDAVLVALGGGAMASGVGYVLKALRPEVEVVCVQPAGAPAMTRSWHARRVVTTDTMDTIADGVAGRFPIPEVLADLLQVTDDAVLVGEETIVAAMRLLLDHAGLVVEPSAALGVAAVLADPARFAGRHVVTVVCGGNVDPAAYRRWVGP